MASQFANLTVDALKTNDGVNLLNNMLQALFDSMPGDMNTVQVYKGYGVPENVVAAGIGSLYLNLSGGSNTTLYAKESGAGTATGWIAR